MDIPFQFTIYNLLLLLTFSVWLEFTLAAVISHYIQSCLSLYFVWRFRSVCVLHLHFIVHKQHPGAIGSSAEIQDPSTPSRLYLHRLFWGKNSSGENVLQSTFFLHFILFDSSALHHVDMQIHIIE